MGHLLYFLLMKLSESDNDKLLGTGEDFHFFVPAEAVVVKGGKDGKDELRLIQGVASTAHKDLQGEVVRQTGIDYGYFMKHGYINDDHKDGPEHKVGEPVECRMTPEGLWIKAVLYKGKERSEYWWDHINALAANNSKRKVGFSIQGKILRRDGHHIVKCWLQDVAITASPVNTNTWAEVVKSLSGQSWCVHPWDSTCVGGCCTCHKSLNEESDEEKALSAGGMGQVMTPESLEGNMKVQTYKSVDRITFEEAIRIIENKGYSPYTAKCWADAIFVTHGIY